MKQTLAPRSFLLGSAIAALLTSPAAFAGNTWDGGGGTGLWNTDTNWNSDTAPSTGVALTFAGNVQNSTSNDLVAVVPSFAGILFTNSGATGNTNAFTLAGSRITLGGEITTTANTAGATITDIIRLNMILSGNRMITTNQLSATVQHNLTISGIMSEDVAGRTLTKAGSGVLILSGANTYSGATTVTGGTLALNHLSVIANSASVSVASGATLRANLAGTYANSLPVTIAGNGVGGLNNGAIHFGSGGNTTTVWNAPITLGGAANNRITSFGVNMNQTLGAAIGGTGPLEIASQGGSGAIHTATWTLNAASNYTGNTTIANINTLKDITVKLGTANALPTTTSLNLSAITTIAATDNVFATLDLNGFSQTLAGLTDTGGSAVASSSSNKRVINSSGTLATLTINNPLAVTYGTTGTNITAGTIGGTTAGGTPANHLALGKNGVGTLTLSGGNTYTGGTTVSAGTLALGANHVLPDTDLTLGAATLRAAIFDDTLGKLNVTGAATINLGAGANLIFADSSSLVTWAGTLNISGTFVPGSSLKFGVGGLTSAQLASISSPGWTSFTIDGGGFLTAGLSDTNTLATAFNALYSFDFDTAGNTEGWTATNANVTVNHGTASGTATTEDPQFARILSFPGNASSGVLIRYRGSHNGDVQLFWGRNGADNFNAARVQTVSYSGSGAWQTLFFSLKGHAEWDDRTITRLRLDPAGPAASTFEIDWLRVLSWDYDNDGVTDFVEGVHDSDGDGLLALEDLDSNGDGIPEAWTQGISNAPGSVHFNFDVNGNAEGWAVGGNLSLMGVANGDLEAQVTGSDPQLVRGRLHLQAALIDGVVIRVQSPSPGNLTLLWSHDDNGGGSFNAARSMTIAVPASPNSARSAYFDLRAATEWKGKLITSLRTDTNFAQGTVFSIDSIRTSDGDYDRDAIPDITEGMGDIDGDGLANYEDIDSDGDGLSDAEETRRGWNPHNPIEATRDSDGDGVTDCAEAIAGSNPDASNDYPKLGIQPDGTGFDLTMQARPGRSYTLERSNNLSNWIPNPVVPQIQASPLLTWQALTNPGTPNKFSRMRVNSPQEMHDPLDGGNPVVEIGNTETAFLDNGVLRMGTPTTQGGSLNYLAPSGGSNLINWADPGRLIQQSYYAGLSLSRAGQSPSWSPWTWNPIQGGDASGKKSQVIEMTQFDSGVGFFTRTVPLLWDMTTGEKGKAWIDQWNQFEPDMPDVIRVTCRFTCFRNSTDIWGGPLGRHQELPAAYLIRSLSKAVTYQGSNPWNNEATEEVQTYFPGASFPWGQYAPSEYWVAMVDPVTNIGVGLYSPMGTTLWNVGAVGLPPGGATSSQTMHMAPIRTLSLGHDSILSYRYWIIYGDLTTIRARVYQLRQRYPRG